MCFSVPSMTTELNAVPSNKNDWIESCTLAHVLQLPWLYFENIPFFISYYEKDMTTSFLAESPNGNIGLITSKTLKQLQID